jgi:hypothetical protein
MMTAVHPVEAEPRAPSGGHEQAGPLAFALVALAAGLVANSLLGPVATGAIEYAIPAGGAVESQLIALDLVALAVVAPLTLALAVLARRGHRLAPVLALGPGSYAAYMFAQYILGPEPLDLPGNSAAFFPLHLVVFVLGGVVAVLAWNAIDLERLPRLGRTERLVGGVLIPIAVLLTFARYVPAIADAAGDTPSAADYLEAPTFFWTIALLDLGVALPAVIAAAIGLRHGSGWARKLACAVAGWLALVGPSVGAMAIAMYAGDAPESSAGQAIALTALGLVFTALAVALYRALARPR